MSEATAGTTPAVHTLRRRGNQGDKDGLALAHVVHERWRAVPVIIAFGLRGDFAHALPPSVWHRPKPHGDDTLLRLVLTELSYAGPTRPTAR